MRAQCAPGWVGGTPNSDMNGSIRWLRMWDPDGVGPLPAVLVAAGDFTAAGTAAANRIATWDGSNWTALSSGLDGGGYCLTSLSSNNHLFVAGAGFTTAGGVSCKRIAQWDGSTWSNLGTGSGNTPSLALLTVTALNADTVVVTGAFTAVAGVPANRVAAYNATTATWSALGDGMSSTTSCAIVMPNGDLVVGGAALTTGNSGSVTLNRIGRWDGSNWNPLAEGTSGLVRCLVVMPNGDLIAGGAFATAGTATVNNIARWNGTSWSSLGSGTNLDVYALAVLPSGDLAVAGDFTSAGGVDANRIAIWNGSTYSPLGSGLPAVVRALAVLPDGDLAVGGDFTTAGGLPAARFARYHFCPATCAADFNGDSAVDFFDYLDFVNAFANNLASADFNHDAAIDFFDYLDFVSAFASGC